MAEVKSGDTVRVHYTGTLDDGTQFDSSAGRDPLQFTVGSGQVIPGFDNGLMGMTVGDKKEIKIPCDDAYGQHRPEMVLKVAKNQLPDNIEPQVGMQLQSQQENGQVVQLVITDVAEEQVTLDANHPLAGKDLTFQLELVEICE